MPTTRKGVWDLQQVRDQYLAGEWVQQFELWSWGYNNEGQLGQNNRTPYSSPVQIPGTIWSSVSAGGNSTTNNYTLATKTDGTLWSWGTNLFGQLGQNNQTQFSSPVQIPGTTWSSVTSGHFISSSIKTDGTLWSWGRNESGQLGQNNTTNRSSPVQIPGTTWNSVSSATYHSLSTKTDGTLWSWGYNGSGQLGQNNRTPYSSPVQIPGTTWSSIDSRRNSSLATKTDGTLWVWGDNQFGQLGQNDRTQFSSPQQIPGTTWNFARFSVNADHTIATKTDGTLWVWGRNQGGNLGQNNTIDYSSPVQIPGTSWSLIGGGGSRIQFATKTDGTLWSLGFNNFGSLGQNNRTYYSSPVQIPGTQWSAMSSGYNHTYNLKALVQ